jgi:hypothetical protein
MVPIKAYLHPLLHLLIQAFLSPQGRAYKGVKPLFCIDIRLFLMPFRSLLKCLLSDLRQPLLFTLSPHGSLMR